MKGDRGWSVRGDRGWSVRWDRGWRECERGQGMEEV